MFARLALTALLLLGTAPNAGPAERPPPPNILVIVLDDLAYGALGAFGGPGLRTSHMDRLAREGVRFTRHYAYSSCSPSRAALLTGLHPARLGFRPRGPGLSPQVPTLAEVLREAGYATHHVGKWQLGETALDSPPAHGFDTWLGFRHSVELRRAGRKGATYRDPWLIEDDGPARRHEGHLTDLLTDRAVEIVRGGADSPPWFLDLWYFAPHHPYEPGGRWAAAQPSTEAGRYRALVAQLDANVGRVLAALEASGQADRTVVVLLSDNGAPSAAFIEHTGFANAKGSLREGGVRTPLAIRWPGVLPAGRSVDAPVMVFDVLPTLARAAGAELPERLDGRDLAPLVAGGPRWRRPLFWEQYRPTRGDELARYLYSVLSPDGRWRLLVGYDGKPVLYDLEADPDRPLEPGEAHAERVQALDRAYRRWHAETRVVPTHLERDERGLWLAGEDLQRVPGLGGFSLGVAAVPAREQGPVEGRQIIARQEGVYEVASTLEGLRAELQGEVLRGPALEPGSCTSVLLTAYFHHSARYPSRNFGVAELYVNGERVASAHPKPAPERWTRAARARTAIGHDGSGGKRFAGALSPPVVWNERLQEHGRDFTPRVEELTDGLCQGA